MNRNIKFQAKRTDNDQWINGSLIINANGKVSIYDSKNFREFYIKENTVSQATGVKDKNGVEIYENDIIRYYKVFHTQIIEIIDKVVFREGMFCLDKTNTPLARCNDNVATDYLSFVTNRNEFPMVESNDYLNNWVVIGNLFDNSELLEGGNG